MQKRSPSPITTFFDKVTARLRGFGLRILVHCSSLFIAGFAMFSRPMPGREKGIVFLSTYIGLACLFSREMALKASWLIPFGAGLAQGGFLAILGFPFHVAVYFAGLQTWLQRIIQKKGENGTEWFAAFFLLIAGINLLRHQSLLPIMISFFLITFIGLFATRRYKTDEFRSIYLKKLQKSLEQFEKAILYGELALEIKKPMEELLSLAKKHQYSLARNSAENVIAIDAISGAAERLGEYLQGKEPEGVFGASGKKTKVSLEQALSRLNTSLEAHGDIVSSDKAKDGAEKARRDLLLRTRPFRESAADLLKKKGNLPENLHGHVENIHQSTLAIIECMETDPHDVEPGARFLERYLAATHRVMDERLRLIQTGLVSSEIEGAMDLSAEILDRLEKAFQGEHAALMKNDVLHFTAEIKVLDSLLKMDGR